MKLTHYQYQHLDKDTNLAHNTQIIFTECAENMIVST